MIKVLVFPNSINPYHKFLYHKFNEGKITVDYLTGPTYKPHTYGIILSLPFKILYFRLKGYTIFHLHWVTFNFPSNHPIFLCISFLYTIFNIFFIKVLGYKLVWTVHNITPHEKQTVNDLFITKFICEIADAKIIHSEDTLTKLKEIGANIKRSYIIPIGNFNDQYSNKYSPQVARKYLNIGPDKFVYLFFGYIKEYKGIDLLLLEFEKLLKTKKSIFLLIAGKCQDENMLNQLQSFYKKYKNNVLVFTDYISDDKVEYFFKSADVVVLPFKKVTTSGSVLLAFNYSKPVISPKMGNIRYFPDGISIFYSNNDKNGLYKTMLKALEIKDSLPILGEKAYEYSQQYNWSTISKQTYELYFSLVDQ